MPSSTINTLTRRGRAVNTRTMLTPSSQRGHDAADKQQKAFEARLLLAYCGIFYLIPFILIVFLGNPLEDSYRPRPNYFLGFGYVLASALIFWVMQGRPRLKFRPLPLAISSLIYSPVPAFVLSALFLGVSLWSFINLGFQFRQTGDSLTEVGLLGFLLVFGKVVMGTSIIVHYRFIKEGLDTTARSISLLMIAMGFAINTQSAFDVLFAFTAYIAATHRLRHTLQLTGKPIQIVSFVLFPFLIVLIFFAGKANKVGVDETIYIITNYDLFLNQFQERYSYAIYSVSTHVEENFFNFGLSFAAITEIVDVTYFRLAALFGASVERPELGTIARMNFFVLSDVYSNRIGISPSMLGSTFFFPGAGLAIFYYVFILRFILSLFWKIMGRTMDNWLFIILSVMLLGTAVDALLDALNPLSVSFVRIMTLYLGASFVIAKLGPFGVPSKARRAVAVRPVVNREYASS